MTAVRGIILIALGVFLLLRALFHPPGQRAWFTYGIGALAIAVGLWRVLRRPDKPLV
jgi:uncharacterized membrane protein HdeD (DUF308 family)